MNGIIPMKREVQNSISILERAKQNVWNRIGDITYDTLENPLTADDNIALLEASNLSINIIDILIDLARSGYDMLSDVNSKESTISSIIS